MKNQTNSWSPKVFVAEEDLEPCEISTMERIVKMIIR